MENIFKKFLGKCWIIYRRPAIAQLICEDMMRVVSSECALADMCPRELTRSKSMPNINL
jgi:hypothetical protein